MKLMAAATIAASVLAAPAAWAQNEASAIHKSQEAARAWLDLLDDGHYAQSWEQAAGPFRHAVSSAGWQAAIRSARQPLGPLRARRLKWATYTENLPGAAPGQYVVLEYESRFDNRVSATETVVPMKAQDGSWRVAAYAIR
jgi:hypothetical protein